jgi:hypothetical protein
LIDHSYSIITREVSPVDSLMLAFAAKLGDLHIVVDRLRIDNRFPNIEHFGSTRIEAMISASDALRSWLNAERAERSLVGSQIGR